MDADFARDGYVVVEDVLDPELSFGPVLADFDDVLDRIVAGVQASKPLSRSYDGLPFTDRLQAVCRDSGRTFGQWFDISLPKRGIRADTPINLGTASFDVLGNDALLDVVERFVGPEIYCNPVQHVRIKLPPGLLGDDDGSGLTGNVAWHQDQGVVRPDADATETLTVWIAVTDATLENGCLKVLPGSHRRGLVEHCPGESPKAVAGGIPEHTLEEDEPVALPMAAGSVLLMHRDTIHAALPNETSDEVRISFDLRYHPVGQPTGRPEFPGFVARSRSEPESELHDHAAWAAAWRATRSRLARQPEFELASRWSADVTLCA